MANDNPPNVQKLMEVLKKAVYEKAFFDELLEKARSKPEFDALLQANPYNLSEADSDRLRIALTQPPVKVDVSLEKFIKDVHNKGGLDQFVTWFGYLWF